MSSTTSVRFRYDPYTPTWQVLYPPKSKNNATKQRPPMATRPHINQGKSVSHPIPPVHQTGTSSNETLSLATEQINTIQTSLQSIASGAQISVNKAYFFTPGWLQIDLVAPFIPTREKILFSFPQAGALLRRLGIRLNWWTAENPPYIRFYVFKLSGKRNKIPMAERL